ncbi:MAG: tRNA (N6-isopentenyl adenosine(37)-C2)-methylthiotransferase MiaB [Planctomycetota bacterium]
MGTTLGQENGTTVFLETFGCQMNFLDSEVLRGRLREAGFVVTPEVRSAEVICLNTCAVREHAEEKVRSRLGLLRRVKERNPSLVIAVVGCMAQREGGDLLSAWPCVDIVCGTGEFHHLPELVDRVRGSGERLLKLGDGDPLSVRREPRAREHRSRAAVAIMRGCDRICSFCIVPRVRGPERHRSIEEVEREVAELVDDGAREIVLLGQTVNSYGRHLASGEDLATLLRRLDRIPQLKRLRFITSFPTYMSDDLVEAMAECTSVSRYLHLPVQSGSNRVLRRMRRGYTVERYLEIVARLRERVAGIELATDVIVGFPGETDEDFMATERLLREVRFCQAFVFKYSPRPGTAAAETLVDDVPLEEKRRRNRHLLSTQEAIQLEKHRALLGTEALVLVEGPSKRVPHRLTGRTDENRIVHFTGDPDLADEFAHVRLVAATPLSLAADLVRHLDDSEVPRPGER